METKIASDEHRHGHNNEPVLLHAPGAPPTFRDQNTDNLLAEKPANIDKPNTVNETVEKMTGNGPTQEHSGAKLGGPAVGSLVVKCGD